MTDTVPIEVLQGGVDVYYNGDPIDKERGRELFEDNSVDWTVDDGDLHFADTGE